MQAARLTAVVVLPTPPFWFAIANVVTADTLAGRGDRTRRGDDASNRRCGVRGRSRTAPTLTDRPPSGRLRATPARRGIPGGVGATLRYTCRWCATLPAYGSLRTTSSRLAARAAARRAAAASCLGLRRPLPSTPTSDPPIASSGAAYSHSTASGASARATTRSWAPSPRRHSSARACTTRGVARSPAALHSRSRNSHLRAALSTSATPASGSAHREHDAREIRRRSRGRRPRARAATQSSAERAERVRHVDVDRRRRRAPSVGASGSVASTSSTRRKRRDLARCQPPALRQRCRARARTLTTACRAK